MRHLIIILALLAAPITARAEPERYALDLAATEVGFTWYFGKDPVQGTMPPESAKVSLDFADPAASRITVRMDATGAKAGFVFATQGLQAPNMLDTAHYPTITYIADRIVRSGDQITTEGRVTIRGVEKPMTMTARFYRPAGQPPGDRSHLVVLLDGSLNRDDFGVSGWSNAVGPTIDLHIRAVLNRVS